MRMHFVLNDPDGVDEFIDLYSKIFNFKELRKKSKRSKKAGKLFAQVNSSIGQLREKLRFMKAYENFDKDRESYDKLRKLRLAFSSATTTIIDYERATVHPRDIQPRTRIDFSSWPSIQELEDEIWVIEQLEAVK